MREVLDWLQFLQACPTVRRLMLRWSLALTNKGGEPMLWSHREGSEKPWVFTAENGRERCFARYSAARAFASVSGTIKNLTEVASEYLETEPPEAAETLLAAVKGSDERVEAIKAARAANKAKA